MKAYSCGRQLQTKKKMENPFGWCNTAVSAALPFLELGLSKFDLNPEDFNLVRKSSSRFDSVLFWPKGSNPLAASGHCPGHLWAPGLQGRGLKMQIVRTKKATASNKKERFKLLGEMGVPVQNGSKFFSGAFGTRHEIQPFFASVCIFSPPRFIRVSLVWSLWHSESDKGQVKIHVVISIFQSRSKLKQVDTLFVHRATVPSVSPNAITPNTHEPTHTKGEKLAIFHCGNHFIRVKFQKWEGNAGFFEVRVLALGAR